MRPDELLTRVRAVPFVPFRIRMTSGRTFDIRHPELLRIGRSTVHIYTYQGEPSEIHERMEMIGRVLIESVAPIEAGQPA